MRYKDIIYFGLCEPCKVSLFSRAAKPGFTRAAVLFSRAQQLNVDYTEMGYSRVAVVICEWICRGLNVLVAKDGWRTERYWIGSGLVAR